MVIARSIGTLNQSFGLVYPKQKKCLKEQENTKAAGTTVVILGSITSVNKKLFFVVVYIAAQLTCRDQNGIFCEFGRTSFFEEQ